MTRGAAQKPDGSVEDFPFRHSGTNTCVAAHLYQANVTFFLATSCPILELFSLSPSSHIFTTPPLFILPPLPISPAPGLFCILPTSRSLSTSSGNLATPLSWFSRIKQSKGHVQGNTTATASATYMHAQFATTLSRAELSFRSFHVRAWSRPDKPKIREN